MNFTTYFNCKQSEKHDFLTLHITQSNYRYKNNKRGESGVRMFWVDFPKKVNKRGNIYSELKSRSIIKKGVLLKKLRKFSTSVSRRKKIHKDKSVYIQNSSIYTSL